MVDRTCRKCDGDGWRNVPDDYARRVHRDLDPARLATLAEPEQVRQRKRLAVRRQIAGNTVWPCAACRPDLFTRWAADFYAAFDALAAAQSPASPSRAGAATEARMTQTERTDHDRHNR